VNYLPYVDNANRCGNPSSPPAGYFYVSPNTFLSKCDISCSTCITTASNCTKCASNYYNLEDELSTCKIYNSNLYWFSIEFNKGYFLDDPPSK